MVTFRAGRRRGQDDRGDHGAPPRVVWCAFQSSPEQTRVRNGMGRNDAANGWEYPGYIRAWENRGPIALLGVVVHDYAGTA